MARLKQASSDPDALISRRILLLSNVIRKSAGLRYRRLLDISVSEWGALAELGARPACSLNELAAGLSLDKTRLSRTIGGLVERGLVDRRANPGDNREVLLSLTPAGRRAFARMMKSAVTTNETLLAGLGEQQRAELFSQIDLLLDRARAVLKDEQETGN